MVAYAAFTQPADSHYQAGRHNTLHAITWGFCGHQYRECAAGREAKQVASCETGRTLSIWTRSSNGLWLGLFQQSKYLALVRFVALQRMGASRQRISGVAGERVLLDMQPAVADVWAGAD